MAKADGRWCRVFEHLIGIRSIPLTDAAFVCILGSVNLQEWDQLGRVYGTCMAWNCDRTVTGIRTHEAASFLDHGGLCRQEPSICRPCPQQAAADISPYTILKSVSDTDGPSCRHGNRIRSPSARLRTCLEYDAHSSELPSSCVD
jgi:hypothetical protein